MLKINRFSTVVSGAQRVLLNLDDVEVTVGKGERVNALEVESIDGAEYYAIQKKSMGLIVLPKALFLSFNDFKGGIQCQTSH